MLIGHIGVGLALKKWDASLNLCWLITAALFSDLLLWLFILLGIERVHIPDTYQELHYLTFSFPYSHGIGSSLGWSICTYLMVGLVTRNYRRAFVLAVGVFSHLWLDYLVHPEKIPLLNNQIAISGLGLWDHLYVALALELLLLLGGLYIYLKATIAHTLIGKYSMGIYVSLLTISLFTGQLLSPTPENAYQIAVSSLGTLGAIFFLAYRIDKKRQPKVKSIAAINTC